MEYLIIHRGDSIYRLRFDREGEELYYKQLTNDAIIFHPVNGWLAHRVMNWLDDRGFEYNWEGNND